MAHPAQRKPKVKSPAKRKKGLLRRIFRAFLIFYAKSLLFSILIIFSWVMLYRIVNPPVTLAMYLEYQQTNTLEYEWVNLSDMSANIPLATVAAEDANFCSHNGFDFDAISAALEDGSGRGASTISQQVAKNVFLWPERSWLRKGMEAGLTVFIEALWSKRRIIEVYLNVAEFGPGVFGIKAAAQKYFGVTPKNLSLANAAKLAVTLPAPRTRQANALPFELRKRASRVASGGATLRRDGRADCFLPSTEP